MPRRYSTSFSGAACLSGTTRQGELDNAIMLHEQQLTVAREIGDKRGEGIALSNLGRTYGST
jgi:hypothetical protein